jgi:hypothetical protein
LEVKIENKLYQDVRAIWSIRTDRESTGWEGEGARRREEAGEGGRKRESEKRISYGSLGWELNS